MVEPSGPSASPEPSDPVEAAAPVRRRFLAAAAAAGTAAVAGCSSVWSQPGATDVVVHNAADAPMVVSVRIARADADADVAHTEETLELAPNDTVDPVNDSKLPTNDAYTVEVSVEGGPSETFEWDDPRLELAPLYVFLDGSENVHFLLKAG